MNHVALRPERNEKPPRSAIYRLVIGAGLLGVSLWGIGVCHKAVQTSLGPPQSPADPGFVSLGALAAWFLFFGPVAAAGFLTLRNTLRKMGALDELAYWVERRAGGSSGLLAHNNQFETRSLGNEINDPHGLESLSAEKIEQLKQSATRAAFLLGVFAGISLLGFGVFGLVFISFISQPYSGSAAYVPLGTGRFTVSLAVFSGICLLLGLAVLQRTFRRENSAWMLPLKLFTYTVLRRQKASKGAGAKEDSPGTKMLP